MSYRERLPAQPFIDWLNAEHERISRDETLISESPYCARVPATERLATRFGVDPRIIRRYRSGLMELKREDRRENVRTETFARAPIENMLTRAGVPFWEVYPEIAAAEEPELEPDAFCPACSEWVTPINGECPWHKKPQPVEGWRAA